MTNYNKLRHKLTFFRLGLFNSLLIDYSAIGFRTLGHHPTMKNSVTLDYASYGLACFIIGCFVFELALMVVKVNEPKFYLKKEEDDSPYEEGLKEFYFEGIKREAIKSNWFARNYNFFYLLRFMVICMIIFNLQYLQAFQVFSSFILMLLFTGLNFYYEHKVKFFKSKYIKVFRLLQEVSMTVMVFFIALFMANSFYFFLKPKTKFGIVIFFFILLLVNIVFEIINGVISICLKAKEKKAKSKSKNFKKIGDRTRLALGTKGTRKTKFKNKFNRLTQNSSNEDSQLTDNRSKNWRGGKIGSFNRLMIQRNKNRFGKGRKMLSSRGIGRIGIPWKKGKRITTYKFHSTKRAKINRKFNDKQI
jgi:hypothetical protein